mmetsp:Transcript_31930/g.5785  ORF Transcript_31930/g.5785 Transcript_31930/m.5785 type:complete len:80 (-) Transcript_31930:409-648(-)
MEALHLLVKNSMATNNFQEVEEFCLGHKEPLLTELLKIYITESIAYEEKLQEVAEIDIDERGRLDDLAYKYHNCAIKLL